MSGIVFKLNDFEGSFDLILHLIKKNKMNIFDIDIMVIIDQYLGYIDGSMGEDFDFSSDFIVMASRLTYIKSLALLPKNDEVKELKQELIGELTDYIICKKVAMQLKDQSDGFYKFVKKSMDVGIDKSHDKSESLKELVKAYYFVLDRQKNKVEISKEDFRPYAVSSYVSVYVGVINILKNIRLKKCVNLNDMFKNGHVSNNVAIFLAALELYKNNTINIDDDLNCTIN